MIALTREALRDTELSWPVTASQELARGRIGSFVEEDVTAPDGASLTREYLRHPGAVAVIAMDAEQRVALVRQYRHPVRSRLVEPPAGLLDVDGEHAVESARRELAEEVGLAADRWHVLVDLFTTPGIVSEAIRIYLARDLRLVDAPDGFLRAGEEAEMDCVWASLDDLVDAVFAGDLHSPSLVSGVLAAFAARERDDFATLRPADAPWPQRRAGTGS